jgi:hypothetical protein
VTWVSLLLADPSPCLRYMVLRELFLKPKDDPEVEELDKLRSEDPLLKELVNSQQDDGSWIDRGSIQQEQGRRIKSTAQALMRLGYLGYGPEFPSIKKGAEFLFYQQLDDGSWPLQGYAQETEMSEGYSMMPLQTALPLLGLAWSGYSTTSRAERAYDWLLEKSLPDGAWPTGIASGNYGRVAGYRKLAHSRWGCRSNTTGVVSCLSLHPERKRSQEAQRALDLLLGRETKERQSLGFEIVRKMGIEPSRGFLTYYARFDISQILDICWRVGATTTDDRVRDLVEFVQQAQGEYGLWNYPSKPQATRWVTFDLLRSLEKIDEEGDWISLEPRTPFRAYKKREKRF